MKQHVPLAHLESGLRSYNRRMPEEHNRVLVDHASDLLLAPTQTAVDHLHAEGLGGAMRFVGDVMTDACLRTRDRVRNMQLPVAANIDPDKPYIVATIHRPENTDNRLRLRDLLRSIQELPDLVVLIAHPRLVAKAEEFGLELARGAVTPIPPLGYLSMMRTLLSAAGVLTDSGGLQKEAFLVGIPCTTLRAETEWVETLDGGWNVLSTRTSSALARRRYGLCHPGLATNPTATDGPHGGHWTRSPNSLGMPRILTRRIGVSDPG